MDYTFHSGSNVIKPPLIVLKNVTKRYGRRPVLRIDQLTICSGEAIALVGANGSGKSTLLRLLAGASLPSRGSVSRSEHAKRMRFVYVPQSGGLYPQLSVTNNLRVYASVFGQPPTAALLKQWYIRDTGLERYLNYPVGELSGGYFRIAVIACALSVEPDVLLLDEPFSGLDRDRLDVLRDGLESLSQNLSALIVSSHQSEELPFCERVCELAEGVIR